MEQGFPLIVGDNNEQLIPESQAFDPESIASEEEIISNAHKLAEPVKLETFEDFIPSRQIQVPTNRRV